MIYPSALFLGTACLLVLTSVAVRADEATIEGDVKEVRESLLKRGSSEAYFKKNAEDRFNDWKAAAEKGSPQMQWLLARCYLSGYGGVDVDKEIGAGWVRKSAEKGFPLAQNSLGLMYATGDGVREDRKEVLAWYHKAAEQGEAIACNNLGNAYEEWESENNLKEAIKWYEKAAEKGYVEAFFNLARIYEAGNGVNKNYEEAARWYQKASLAGHPRATALLILLYEDGKELPKDPEKAKLYREKLREQVGDGSEEYLLLVGIQLDPVGRQAPNAKGLIDDKKFKLSDYRGKVVVLKFGTPTSAPCKSMAPQLKALVKRLEDQPFALLDVDTEENPELALKWNIIKIPSVYVIDETGIIRYVGCRDEALDKAVDTLLKKLEEKKEDK